MTTRPNIVGPEYLADLLQRTVKTIRTDASRRPESLPPRLVIPGTARLMWVEEDVLAWLNSFRPQPKKKAGRPVNPAYLQSMQGQGGSTFGGCGVTCAPSPPKVPAR